MKTILVTGGSGFIGSHLCERLLKQGQRVICLDNLLTSLKDNIVHFLENKNFVFLQRDIIDFIDIDEPIDEIYNLACPASPVHYQKNAIRTIKANTLGVINVLGLARAKKAKILQASTSEVYGEPLIHPQNEEYKGNVSITGPRACYDEGKRCAETLFFDYNRSHGLKIKVIRIFNTYGPCMSEDDGRVISNFIVQALKNQDLTIYGNGNQTRSFCYVDDLVDGIIKMMESADEVVGPINLGNPRELAINEIAAMILKLCRSKSKIIFKDLPVDDPTRRCPDIAKAKNVLHWEPRVGLENGLVSTIEYFRETLS